MTAETPAVQPVGPASSSDAACSFDAARFLRAARAETRARAPRTDRFVDAYVLVLAVLTIGAWVYGLSSGLGGQLGTLLGASGRDGPLHREAAPWLGPGFPVLGASLLLVLAWAGLVRALLVLGPVGIAPDRAFWVWRLPGTDDREPVRVLRRAAAAVGAGAGALGLCAVVVAGWAGALALTDPWAVAAPVLGCAVLGAAGVGVAARWQAARADVSRPSDLPGDELRRAGARTRYLATSVRLMSTSDLRQSLAGVDQSAVRRPSADIPGWVRGPRRVVLFAALAAEARTPWRSRAAVDLLVLALLLVAFPAAVVLAAWAGLLVVAYRGLGRGVGYVVAARSGNAAEQNLPLSGAAAAGVHLVVPCALNALVVGAASGLAGLAVQGPVPAHLAAGLVAGCGIGAAAVHRVLAPDPDLTLPPIDSPAGPIPHAQLVAYGRGLGLVLLLAASPAALVVVPDVWPVVLATLGVFALVAVGLAAGADSRR